VGELMGWASHAIAELQKGNSTIVKPRGHSMEGFVEDGQAVRLDPIPPDGEIRKGDVVLCRVRGHEYLHLVHATGPRGCLIGNARGHLNGWAPRSHIFGRLGQRREE